MSQSASMIGYPSVGRVAMAGSEGGLACEAGRARKHLPGISIVEANCER